MRSAPDVQATFVATLVDEWVRAGVTDAVVAPGSRSTPVLQALAGDGRLRLHRVLDERAGGFVALGLGAATGRPAPVVTTSGTAAVELHPAVVEAHQAGVPMLVVTADRPAELHHVGAPQTVEQVGLYPGATRWALSCPVPTAAAAGAWRSIGARSVADAVAHPAGPGPVHLNLELREPLLGTPGPLPPGRPGGAPWHRVSPRVGSAPAAGTVDLLASHAGGRGLIVAGALSGPPDQLGAVLDLAQATGWPVLADPRSGLRRPHPLVVAAADSLLRTPEVVGWTPSIVLRLGRPWASKVLGQWLAALGPDVPQVVVDPAGEWADPDRTACVVERSGWAELAHAVLAKLGPVRPGPAGSWSGDWAAAEAAAQGAVDQHLSRLDHPIEPAVARRVAVAVPDGGTLVVASSMPVRDVEWWSAPRRGLRVLANRGANGIDGTIATAVGVALAGDPVTCLVGDLAFVYDAGALLWASTRELTLTVVVVDNDGGGIFSFLPQAAGVDPARFEDLWGTPHGLDLVELAGAYRVPAARIAALDELATRLADPRPGVSVLVVPTDRAANPAEHAALDAAVAAAVAAEVGRGSV